MSGARAALDRLEAAVEPLVADTALPAQIRRLAALACETGDMVAAAEAMIPLIIEAEGAAQQLEAHARRLRQVLAETMDATGAATIRSTWHTASVSPGRASVAIIDEAQIPPTLFRTPPPAPDKAAIAKLLAAGQDVPGAALRNGAPSISIRSRAKEIA